MFLHARSAALHRYRGIAPLVVLRCTAMTVLRRLAALLLIVVALIAVAPTAPALAHQNGCHAAHSCPSDANPPTYMCGDTGNYAFCPGLSGSAFATGSTSATVGSALYAYVSWSVAVTSASTTYQWYRSGVAIPGAVTTSYTVTLEDIGQAVVMTASAVDGRGQSATVSTSPVIPAYPPLPTGSGSLSTSTATVGTAVRAIVKWSRAVSATYQWFRAGVPIAEATATVYTTTKADLGRPLKFVATVTEYGRTTSVSTPVLTPIATSKLKLETRPTLRAGGTAVVHGNLSTAAGPAGRIVRVRAWQKAGHRWLLRRNIATAVSSTGSFTIKQRIRSHQKGSWRFKASYAGAADAKAAQSPYAPLLVR
jgi:hypothetical protein